MRKIIRLTESDLHNLVQRSVLRILREQDNNLLLQSIAQGLVQQQLTASQGENEVEVQLQGDAIAQINFVVESDPYMPEYYDSPYCWDKRYEYEQAYTAGEQLRKFP